MQKISSIYPFIHTIQQILESHDWKGATPTFDYAHPIISSFPEFVLPLKKSVYSIDSFMTYNQFKSPMARVTTPIFKHTLPNIFLSTLNFWYQSARKQVISSLCSRDMFDLKILESDWPRPFWPNMTEKQTNRFIVFTFGQSEREAREVREVKEK